MPGNGDATQEKEWARHRLETNANKSQTVVKMREVGRGAFRREMCVGRDIKS